MIPKKLSDIFFCFRFMFEKKHFFHARFFKNPEDFGLGEPNVNGIPIVNDHLGRASGKFPDSKESPEQKWGSNCSD